MIERVLLEKAIFSLREYRANTKGQDLQRTEFCLTILSKMHREYAKLESEICPYSCLKMGYELEKHLGVLVKPISDELYIICAWFTREMLLFYERIQAVPMDLDSEWRSFLYDTSELLSSNNNLQRDYVRSSRFDVDVLNNYLGDKTFQSFIDYENKVKESKDKMNEMDAYLEKEFNYIKSLLAGKIKLTINLATQLEKYSTAFNFVGLYKGFDDLSKLKNEQKDKTYQFSILLGVALILVPILSIFLQSYMGVVVNDTVFDFKTLTVTSQFNWVKIFPVLGLEFILIYFFRIVLNRLNTLQTEIVQIELRKSLCQFIQEYAKYARELREHSSSDGQEKVNLLEKFENIIFSNILSQPEKVPSTFDGLEQLSNFLKEFKK